MTGSRASRPLRALIGLGLCLTALAPARGASTAVLEAPGARVDPALAEALSAGRGAAIFTWSETTPRDAVADHLASAGISHRLFESFRAGVACIGPADLAALRRTPGVPALFPDRAVVTPALVESVPEAFNGDPDFWWGQEGITGDGIGLVVMDTGVDGTHPDLEFGRRLLRNLITLHSHREYKGPSGADEYPCSDVLYPPAGFTDPVFGDRLPDPVDSDLESGHGTHIASVAAGDGTASGGVLKGMAPEADLWGYRVIGSASPTHQVDANGEEYRPSLVRVLAAMEHLLSYGYWEDLFPAKVVLLGFTMEGLLESDHPFMASIDGLDALDISVVAPVGNEGGGPSSCDAAETCHISYYSAHPWVIAVGASDGRTTLAPYSTIGDPADRPESWLPGGAASYRPTLIAPGTRVVAAERLGLAAFATIDGEHTLAGQGDGGKSRYRGYQSLTGTSVAAAHVAGAIALMQQAAFEAKGCYLTTEQVREILRQTATSMPGYEAHEVGAGALDATAAIWGARFAPIEGPTYDPVYCPEG